MSETVKGLTKLLNTLEKVPRELEPTVNQMVEGYAQSIERDAKDIAPRDTGFLRDNIKAEKINKNTWRVVSNAPYAAYVEYGKPIGTGPNGGPKPYLYPSYFKNIRRFTDDLEDLLDNTFRKI